MTKQTELALKLIAGCPGGITEDLLAFHGVTCETLAQLVEAGCLDLHTKYVMSPYRPGLIINRYFIREQAK